MPLCILNGIDLLLVTRSVLFCSFLFICVDLFLVLFQQPTWRLWGEERVEGAIYTVYLKKVRYHRPTRSASSVSFILFVSTYHIIFTNARDYGKVPKQNVCFRLLQYNSRLSITTTLIESLCRQPLS